MNRSPILNRARRVASGQREGGENQGRCCQELPHLPACFFSPVTQTLSINPPYHQAEIPCPSRSTGISLPHQLHSSYTILLLLFSVDSQYQPDNCPIVTIASRSTVVHVNNPPHPQHVLIRSIPAYTQQFSIYQSFVILKLASVVFEPQH